MANKKTHFIPIATLFAVALLSSGCSNTKKPEVNHNLGQENPAPQNTESPTVTSNTATLPEVSPWHTGTIPADATDIPQSALTNASLANYRSNVTLAVIDSGVDLQHTRLSSFAWLNPGETLNSRDDDGNSYVDDMNGWNFTEDNNETVDYSRVSAFSAEVRNFFLVSGKRSLGTATSSEIEWFESKKNDEAFMAQVDAYGNFAHGTHVSGIATSGISHSKVMSLKIIETNKNTRNIQFAQALGLTDTLLSFILNEAILKFILNLFGGSFSGGLTDTMTYVASKNAGVANCSFGITSSSLSEQVNEFLTYQKISPSSVGDLFNLVNGLTSDLGSSLTKDIQSANNTLFVIAAGNESSDNDSVPVWPANVKTENAIAVAATVGRTKLASFSNYGVQMVEVAAPGVAISSAAPGNESVVMSGTSMASPYVANVSLRIRGINPNLTPAQTKQILMETVDVKDFLRGKVSTSGIVNPARATKAAELSATMDLATAIAQSKTLVSDEIETSLLPASVVDAGSSSTQPYVSKLGGFSFKPR